MNFVRISRTEIKNINNYPRKKPILRASEQLNDSVNKLLRKAEKDLPDRGGGFDELEESYQTKGGTVTLKIKPSTDPGTPDYRIFKVEFTTHAKNKFTPIFERGTKRDLQRMLSDSSFRDRVESAISIAITTLKKNKRL